MLETERLLIRKMRSDDAEFQYRLMNSPHWLKYIGDRHIYTINDSKNYLLKTILKSYADNGFGSYLVLLKDSKIPIGICGIYKRESLENEDLGFAFLPEFIGKGYAYEASLAVIEYAKSTLGLKKLLAITTKDNVASIKLLEKLGFKFLKKMQMPNDDEVLRLYGREL